MITDSSRRMRILLIEDNATVARTIQISLEQHGYCVDVVGTVHDGDEAAVIERHDAIIIDVMLPDGDGVELCRQLRRQKVATPILMLSALGSTPQKVVGLDAGADDYLSKPFESEELLARLRSLLRRSQATEGAVMQSGDIVMDLREHRVSLDGVEVKLSAKEFALLEYMMRNPGRLLTRTMISESVWDMNYESSSNVIDVYVSSLRRKIDRGQASRRIQTVVGSGYRFVDPGERATGASSRDLGGAPARETPTK
jgi:DNA-binding response OmpR family regulator